MNVKKILSYILISLILSVNLFAPLSVFVGQNNKIEISRNIASAADGGITMKITPSKSSSTIRVDVDITWSIEYSTTSEGVRVTLKDSSGNILKQELVTLSGGTTQTGFVQFNDLKENTTYNITSEARQIARLSANFSLEKTLVYNFGTLWQDGEDYTKAITEGSLFELKDESSITTYPIGTTSLIKGDSKIAQNELAMMPTCDITEPVGCAAWILYGVIFKPTSWILAFTGKLFDWTFNYSVLDSSYRSGFVVEGWGIVRDLCNMFFIFILLYIAIGTVLSLHGVKTKEMIINVVIIGLFINFSLFATQVIIDASNIMARVFYNQISITQKNDAGVSEETNGSFGEKKLSEALYQKINPQQILLSAGEAGSIKIKGVQQETAIPGKVSNGTFILITILASAMNIVGIIVFLSVSLVFISRVIGLWMAMIFSPLVFFSYAVPQMQDVNMVGWKKWWPETLKMAFLAPVFIFFIYIIIKFLDKGLNIIGADTKTGLDFYIAVIVPFVFLMLLLWKAKEIASDMSGTMGKQITGGIAAAGGMVLGGAALGGALLGRKAVGSTAAWMSRSESSEFHGEQKMKFKENLKSWEQSGSVGVKPTWEKHLEDNTLNIGGKKLFYNKKGETVEYKDNLRTRLGGALNEKQKKVEGVDHARHVVDEAKDKAGFKDTEFNNLSGVQQGKVKDIYVKENKSKWAQEEEDKFRTANGYDDKHALNPSEIKQLRDNVTTRALHEFEHEMSHAAEKVNGITRAFSKVNTSSWDVRNLSQLKSDKREGFMSKIPTAMIAGVALGVRSGLKSSGVNHGQGQGDFMKDIGSTITEALKGIKIEVPKAASGGGHGGGDTHGAASGGHH